MGFIGKVNSYLSSLQDQYSNPTQDSFTRQILIDHLRHLSSARRQARAEPPPNYDEVVKPKDGDGDEDEEQPPSYVQAMERLNSVEEAEPEGR